MTCIHLNHVTVLNFILIKSTNRYWYLASFSDIIKPLGPSGSSQSCMVQSVSWWRDWSDLATTFLENRFAQLPHVAWKMRCLCLSCLGWIFLFPRKPHPLPPRFHLPIRYPYFLLPRSLPDAFIRVVFDDNCSSDDLLRRNENTCHHYQKVQ